MQKKIMVLGSGELAKEFIISAQRYGQYTISVDSYENAPGMQVADTYEVINMLEGNELDRIVKKHSPDIIVPEIEAIRTERFFDYEKQGIQVVPSAKAANYTMNRKAIRDLAAKELGLKTAKYKYATSLEELESAAEEIGNPCVVKPLMSSSGKGQTLVRTKNDIKKAWENGTTKSRGDIQELIIEEFIEFDTEITLLTVTQQNGKTLFCYPIGHIQKEGDYRESWQPATISEQYKKDAEEMAAKVTKELGGAGIWGVEFFLTKDGVYFSELSPRPHDTGMVTLAKTQNLNEFELHLRAVLGLPITEITLEKAGASAVILATEENKSKPVYSGITESLAEIRTEIRLFNKPSTRVNRRMAIALSYGDIGTNTNSLREKARNAALKIKVN